MNSFNLFRLPLLAYEEIIKMMIIQEIFCLSYCSRRVTEAMSIMNIKLDAVFVHWDTIPVIEIWRTENEICFVNLRGPVLPSSTSFLRCPLRHETKRSLLFLTKSKMEDCAQLSDHVQSVFKINEFHVIFNPDSLKLKKMRKHTSIALAKNYDCISIAGKKHLPLEFFNYLMNTVKLTAGLKVKCVMPQNFRHENAMKFRSVEYSEASWVTLDDLKSVRNTFSVKLGSTLFNCKDINNFLHFWINCDYDMMEWLRVSLVTGIDLDREAIFDGLVTVKSEKSRGVVHYLLSKEHSQKKFTVGAIIFNYHDKALSLEAYEPDDIFANTISCLKFLEQRKNLKNTKIEMNSMETNLLKNWNEYTIGDFDKEINAIRSQKEQVDMELGKIQMKLDEIGFVDD